MIPYSKQSIQPKDLEAVGDVLSSRWLTQGPKVPEFENSLSETFRVRHAVACSSGTAALQLAYAAMGVNSSSLGVVPAITFAATANAFRNLGAEVIFCDVNRDDGMINLDSLEMNLIQSRKFRKFEMGVISPVSLAGKAAPLHEVFNLAQKYEFHVVEDASHSPGGYSLSEPGRRNYSASCQWSDAATISFHPVKHICSGEGGAVLTNSKEIRAKAEILRSHGITRETEYGKERPWYYEQIDLGWNFRLTDIQAALGIEQLKRLPESIAQRHKIAKKYDHILSGKEFTKRIDLPHIDQGHALHLYVIHFKEVGHRDQAYIFLKNRGISTQIHYIPLYRHPYHKGNYVYEDFPGAEAYFESCLSIPMYPTLTQTEQDSVIAGLSEFLS